MEGLANNDLPNRNSYGSEFSSKPKVLEHQKAMAQENHEYQLKMQDAQHEHELSMKNKDLGWKVYRHFRQFFREHSGHNMHHSSSFCHCDVMLVLFSR